MHKRDKNIEVIAGLFNDYLTEYLTKYLNRKIVLFFSGGVDCLWIYAILKKINHSNFRVVHMVPKELDKSKIRDYRNTKRFEYVTNQVVEYIEYPLFDTSIHYQMKKNSNRGFFRTMEEFIYSQIEWSEDTLFIRGEDRRIHTPFLRFSDFRAANRSFGFPYWRVRGRFRGEHIVGSLWNRYIAKYKGELKIKKGLELDVKGMSYHEAHLILCQIFNGTQCIEDERIAGLYAKFDVIFPFSTEAFRELSILHSLSICKYIEKNHRVNEFFDQKVLIHTALNLLGIPSAVINSKSTLEMDHPEFDEFLRKNGLIEGTLQDRWLNYYNRI